MTRTVLCVAVGFLTRHTEQVETFRNRFTSYLPIGWTTGSVQKMRENVKGWHRTATTRKNVLHRPTLYTSLSFCTFLEGKERYQGRGKKSLQGREWDQLKCMYTYNNTYMLNSGMGLTLKLKHFGNWSCFESSKLKCFPLLAHACTTDSATRGYWNKIIKKKRLLFLSHLVF